MEKKLSLSKGWYINDMTLYVAIDHEYNTVTHITWTMFLNQTSFYGNQSEILHCLLLAKYFHVKGINASLIALLIWDATCPDTFASSYSPSATREAGAVAALAEERKTAKYAHLNPTHAFTPAAIETSGVFGPQTMAFLKKLGQRLAQASGDERSTTYLFQRLSVAVQRGNSASVLGTTGQLPGQDFLF